MLPGSCGTTGKNLGSIWGASGGTSGEHLESIWKCPQPSQGHASCFSSVSGVSYRRGLSAPREMAGSEESGEVLLSSPAHATPPAVPSELQLHPPSSRRTALLDLSPQGGQPSLISGCRATELIKNDKALCNCQPLMSPLPLSALLLWLSPATSEHWLVSGDRRLLASATPLQEDTEQAVPSLS